MGEDGVVRPDQVSLGVLVTAVQRDAVDAAVAVHGVGAKRSDGKLPAHVTAYLTMGLCLFAEDDYTEVATKVTGSLSVWGCWDARWSVPTSSGITQARKRLGPNVLAEVFEQVAEPVATPLTRGAWLRGWRLLAIDGLPFWQGRAGHRRRTRNPAVHRGQRGISGCSSSPACGVTGSGQPAPGLATRLLSSGRCTKSRRRTDARRRAGSRPAPRGASCRPGRRTSRFLVTE
jgi:hypothetical protein